MFTRMRERRDREIDEVTRSIQAEFAEARLIPLGQALQPYLVQPFVRMLKWDYGAGYPTYPMWVIAELGPERPGLQLGYSEYGHGRSGHRWGILFADSDWFGMDSSWFKRLEDVFIESGCWPHPMPGGYAVD